MSAKSGSGDEGRDPRGSRRVHAAPHLVHAAISKRRRWREVPTVGKATPLRLFATMEWQLGGQRRCQKEVRSLTAALVNHLVKDCTPVIAGLTGFGTLAVFTGPVFASLRTASGDCMPLATGLLTSASPTAMSFSGVSAVSATAAGAIGVAVGCCFGWRGFLSCDVLDDKLTNQRPWVPFQR